MHCIGIFHLKFCVFDLDDDWSIERAESVMKEYKDDLEQDEVLLKKAFDGSRGNRREVIANLKGSCKAIVNEFPLLRNIIYVS